MKFMTHFWEHCKLIDIYHANFVIWEYLLKDKDIKSPWTGNGLKKFLEIREGLHKTIEDESNYKTYNYFFFKKLSKKATWPFVTEL